jgi:hypothetical protein
MAWIHCRGTSAASGCTSRNIRPNWIKLTIAEVRTMCPDFHDYSTVLYPDMMTRVI